MFVVPASKATDPANRFEFEFEGEARSAPLLEFVSTETALLFTQAITDVDMRAAYCRALADGDDDAEVALLRLGKDALEALTDAYDEASGVTGPESDASTDS